MMCRKKVRYLREVWMKTINPDALRIGRRRRGYTQRNLAALCDCTQATISALERGEMRGCSYDLAKTIAKWLDRDLEELFEAHSTSRARRVTSTARRNNQTGRTDRSRKAVA